MYKFHRSHPNVHFKTTLIQSKGIPGSGVTTTRKKCKNDEEGKEEEKG